MNPAVLRLLCLHAAARFRRMRRSLTNPRRMVLTVAAILLGMIWLGQAIASVLFRESYDPESFRRWTSLVLMLYFGWHVVRVAYRRPDQAIEWSGAEAEQVVGGPFTRRDILTYRFLVILTSTLPKALFTALVLLPDLWWSGLPGILLALVFLESFRLAIDIAVCCLSDKSYLVARTVVFGMMMAAAGGLLLPDRETAASGAGNAPALTQWLTESLATAQAARESQLVVVLERPFVVFANIISARQFSLSLLVDLSVTLLMVAGLLAGIVGLDRLHEAIDFRRQREFREHDDALTDAFQRVSLGAARLPWIPRLGTIGPILWRQVKSAGRYKGSLLVALAIPAVLSCGPLLTMQNTTSAFLAMVAAVVFYSFVLLPEAIKFDFRLDCDHLTQLKLLPISSHRVVVGQLAVPVLIATLFQVTLFVFAGTVRPVSPLLIVAAIVLTVPINALFVALDNVIFLLYPHRPTQEGFEAFLRTILKFTFKSVLLGVAGTMLFGWALASRYLVEAGGMPHLVQPVFVAGITIAAWVAAVLAFAVVARAFDHFDVSVSVPS